MSGWPTFGWCLLYENAYDVGIKIKNMIMADKHRCTLRVLKTKSLEV